MPIFDYVPKAKTCKDCVHYDVCKYKDEKVSLGITVKETMHNCKDFKNKADFVEVVRCGECKHKGWIQEPCHGKTVDFCRIHEICIEKTDFCRYGDKEQLRSNE